MANRPPKPGRPANWARYGVAVASVIVGLVARELMSGVFGPTALPFIFFFPAVAVATWYGGAGPGALATVLSAAVAAYFFIDPVKTLAMPTIHDVAGLAAFIVSSAFILGAVESMHRARARLNEEIDRRQEAQAALSREKELLGTTLASIGDGVIATDSQGRITFLNPEAVRLTGWPTAEAAGRPLPEVFRIIQEQTRQPAENPVQKVLQTGEIAGLANHTFLVSRSGLEIPIADSAAPIRQADGSISGVVLVFRDATVERTAREASERLAAIVEYSGDVILTKNLEGIIQSWNGGAERLFGYRAEEVVGKPVTVLFPPDRLKEEDHILGLLRSGEPLQRLETVRVAKDGRQIPVLVSISPLKDENGRVIGASKVIHDMTDLVAAREELMREKELLATTLASIGDGVIVTDDEGRVTFVNGEAERLTGWKNSEAIGQPLPAIFRIIHEKTRQPAENPIEKVLRLGAVVGLANHTLLITRDGREIPIDDSGAPIRRPGGPLFGVVLVFRDFTEQKQAAEALREAHEKLASHAFQLEQLVQKRTARLNEIVGDLEAFSYSIVHDMRAPLRAMQSFASLLGEEYGNVSPTADDYIRRIQTAAERMDRLIQDGLNYSRLMRAELPLVPMDVAVLLRGMIETYPAFQPPQAQIELEGNFPLVRTNEAGLTQCVSNLLGNAVKFVAPGVTPRVRIWAESRQDRVRLYFRDNGIGIEKFAHEKIFQIFYRLQNKYEGTGIGLAIVRKASERMGGTVGLESEPGQGSTFWLELQAAQPGKK